MKRALALGAVLAATILPLSAGAFAPPALQIVRGSELSELANRVARQAVNDPDRSVIAAFQLTDQSVPAGSLSVATGPLNVNPAYLSVPIVISVDGKVSRTVFVGYRIAQFVHTAVAAHDLAPGRVIAPGDVSTARVISVGRPAVETAALIGRKLNVAMARGNSIFVEQTSTNEIVKAGQPVMLVIRDGPVALTADVIARTGGGLGDHVAVYNPRTNRALSGTVTAPGRVELVLPGGEEGQ